MISNNLDKNKNPIYQLVPGGIDGYVFGGPGSLTTDEARSTNMPRLAKTCCECECCGNCQVL